ncbi:FAD-dependent oxidoreductase [Mycobacterium sp. 134]|uniref:FAD-dependent oxidoreductase n=1 Tax=Mycobacterium sp. 134 TaxID=3400425 RepID=UPI003AAD814E
MIEKSDVTVIGAGPVGASAALLLAAHGLECTLVERREAPSRHPAAHVMSTRSMEVWRALGLDEEISSQGAPIEDLKSIVYCTTMTGLELGRVQLADLPDGQIEAITALSPTHAGHIPQNVLEPLLWEQVRRSPRIHFHTGCEYVEHKEGSDGIEVLLRTSGVDPKRMVQSQYVIAADGAGSAVRRRSNITMDGPILQHVISVHFAADLDRFRRHRPGPVVWTHTAAGVGALIVHRAPGDLVFQIPYFPPYQSIADFPAEVCRGHIRAAIGEDSALVDIKSILPWAMTAQVATAYRKGRIFLAGDAAHRFPPTGGRGLNTGIADVHNLAWKLAWVLANRADNALLDTYELDRRPEGLVACTDSVANFDGVFEVLAAVGVPSAAARSLTQVVTAVPDWIPHSWVRRLIALTVNLGMQPLRLAAWQGVIGRTMRKRASVAIGRQGPHYRSWGKDLGVVYSVSSDSSDRQTRAEIGAGEFYLPKLVVGGRFPHAWIDQSATRTSTLDVVATDQLTVFLSRAGHSRLSPTVGSLGVRSVRLGAGFPDEWWTELAGEPDAVLVRPDGHIVAILTAEDDPELLHEVVHQSPDSEFTGERRVTDFAATAIDGELRMRHPTAIPATMSLQRS